MPTPAEVIALVEDAYERVPKVGRNGIYESELRVVLRAAADALASAEARIAELEVGEPLPVIAHKGPLDTDASMFREAADRLERGYPLGGGNLTRAVIELILREVARSQRPALTATAGEESLRDAKAEGWEEGVATALNHAKRGSDGISLKLVTFDGDAWQNPYRLPVGGDD